MSGLSPIYSNDQSEWTSLPGLYISSENVPPPISGIQRNKVGVCGECVRGPVNILVECPTPSYFAAVFGGRDATADGSAATIVGQVWKALLNKKWGTIKVIRVAAAAAVKATKNLLATATPIVRVDAANVGVWGNSATVAVTAATNGDSNYKNIVISYLGTTYTLQNIITTSGNDNTATVVAAMWPDVNTRLFTLTKLADGICDVAGAASLASGSDGSIANSDFTATDGPMEQLAADSQLQFVWVAERSNSTIKDKWETLSASTYGKRYGITTDASTTSAADARTDNASYRSRWLTYVRNWPLTLDPYTAAEITVDPISAVAIAFNQTNPNQHLRHKATCVPLLKYASNLTTQVISRADLKLDDAAGIMTLTYDDDSNVRFSNWITTSLTAGEVNLAEQRMKFKIEQDLAVRIDDYVAALNTASARRQVLGLVSGYLKTDMDSEQNVKEFAAPGFIETDDQAANGIGILAVRARLLNHWQRLVLKTSIGTGVEIIDAATLGG